MVTVVDDSQQSTKILPFTMTPNFTTCIDSCTTTGTVTTDTITTTDRNPNDASNIPVPLSYSSADSATEYASLFGEAIISKDTACTTTAMHSSSHTNNNSNNNNNNSSRSDTVIMMLDHSSITTHNTTNSNHNRTNVVDDNDENIITTSSMSVDAPMCPSLCSNNNDNYYPFNSNNVNYDSEEKKVDTTTSSDTPASPSIRDGTKLVVSLLPPLKNGNASPRREPLMSSTGSTTLMMEEQPSSYTVEKSRSTNEFLDVIGCPCFQPEYHHTSTTTTSSSSTSMKSQQQQQLKGLQNASSSSDGLFVLPKIRSRSLFDDNEKKDDVADVNDEPDNDDAEDDEEEFQLNDELMTGIIEETGAQYHITKIIVEGWIHKKGTGHDWLGSRGWKARWARLAIGYIDGYDNVEVPLLGISWYPTSTNNSTVIVLDSTVVLAVDLPNKDRSHRFEIRHAKRPASVAATVLENGKKNHFTATPAAATTATSTTNNHNNTSNTLPITRTFAAASRKARDAWVYAISQALLSYEKDKAALRKMQLMAIRNGNNNNNNNNTHQSSESDNTSSHRSSSAGGGGSSNSPPTMKLSPKKTRHYDDQWSNDHFPQPPTIPTVTTSNPTRTIGSRSRSPSPSAVSTSRHHQQQGDGNQTIGGSSLTRQHLNQSRTQQLAAVDPGRSKSPIMMMMMQQSTTSIIGQDGAISSSDSTNNSNSGDYNNNSSTQQQRMMKPMTIRTRSSSA